MGRAERADKVFLLSVRIAESRGSWRHFHTRVQEEDNPDCGRGKKETAKKDRGLGGG